MLGLLHGGARAFLKNYSQISVYSSHGNSGHWDASVHENPNLKHQQKIEVGSRPPIPKADHRVMIPRVHPAGHQIV